MKTTTRPKPHTYTTPVVREVPRPPGEPASWASCW
jgi:hypothetical protein